MENEFDSQSEAEEEIVVGRTRALKLIRSLVNLYRLCYGVPSSI